MQATRSKPRCKQSCPQHIFELKNNNGNNKMDVKINFCPKFRRDPHPPEKTIPQFNLDNKYFTHAFVLGTQKKNLANNSHHQQVHFQTMIKDACQKNNQIFFPRPKQNNSFCSVCKEHFKNYYEHIRTQPHRIKIDAAVYNTEIKRLCQFYKVKWNGAHEKADQILNELFKNAHVYEKGVKQSNDDEDQNEESQQNNQQQRQCQLQQKQQEQQRQQDGQGLQIQGQVEVNQNQQQNENLQQNQEDKQGSQDEDQDQNKKKIQDQDQKQNDEKKSQNKKQKLIQGQMQNQNEQNINHKLFKPQDQKKNQQQPFRIKKGGKKRQNINQQNGIEEENLQSNSKSRSKNQQPSSNNVNVSFFQKNSQFVVFLRKNNNGKYEIYKDSEKLLKNNGEAQQKGNPRSNRPAQQRYNLRGGQRQRYNYKQDRYNLRQQRERKKTKDIDYIVPRYVKQPKTIYKIKYPEQKQAAESQNSSFKFNEDEKLCQVLKQRIFRDRVKTRNERKEEKNISGENDKEKEKKDKDKEKDKDKDKDKQKDKQKQKQKDKKKDNNKEKEIDTEKSKEKEKQKQKQKDKNDNKNTKIQSQSPIQGSARQKSRQGNQRQPSSNSPNAFNMSVNPNGSNGPINYAMYGPPPLGSNRVGLPKMPPYPMYLPPPPHGQSNSIGAKINTPPNRMNPGGYIPPSMMMNHPQYFNPGPMPYNVPNSDDKTKQGRPTFPPMYYPPWGYMMPPPSMIPPSTPQGNSQSANMPRQNVGPPPPYRMMPHPPANGSKSNNSSANSGTIQGMNSNMVYMQYPMGPRYPYMSYPYMPKQGQQSPRDPR